VDLRKEGSGNIGATNALRVLGKKWGYLVFAADILKGWLSVKLGYALAYRFAPDHLVALGVVAALFSVLGHNFPVWLGFNGGKGIATSAGIMIALFPIWVFLCGLVVWVMIFFTTRYVSVASIFAAISLSFSTAILAYIGKLTNSPNGSKGDWLLVVVAVIMSALAVWRHKSNIERLFSGKEKKFERRKSSSGS
ncbi:MAG TPA: glycerol-3-phosphate 1-O-acyltransferase PlsY, partial [Terrimicrobiaceae bacterium]